MDSGVSKVFERLEKINEKKLSQKTLRRNNYDQFGPWIQQIINQYAEDPKEQDEVTLDFTYAGIPRQDFPPGHNQFVPIEKVGDHIPGQKATLSVHKPTTSGLPGEFFEIHVDRIEG